MSSTAHSPDVLSLLHIRRLRRADLPALEWEGEYTHFRRMFKQAYDDAQRGSAIHWVAVLRPAKELIGQVFVQLRSRHNPAIADGQAQAYLYSIRVKEKFRNEGVGSHLMDAAEDDLRLREFSVAMLNVARDNPAAQQFYTRRGYQVAGAEAGQWSYIDHHGWRRYVDEPAWRMEKRL